MKGSGIVTRNYIALRREFFNPRSPTDTWNMWHQDHIDRIFNRLIQNMIAKYNVNPNKIFLLGYSAGGDGVYQLAPRMADRFAAASMSAGHPNDASPLGLRNIGFSIHMGKMIRPTIETMLQKSGKSNWRI